MGPTQARGIIGSPGFMSPEQAMGEPVGPPTDIFSLGSVLAYAATGEPPFGDGPPSTLLYRAVHGEPAIRNLPPELRPVVARCLLADPAARPTTDELLGELGEATPTQGWLDWLRTGEAPARRAQNTVPSQAWDDAIGEAADEPADYLPSDPAAFDDDALPSVPAGAGSAAVPAAVGEVPGFATSGTGREESPRAGTTARDADLAASPARSLSWVFPEPGDAPSGASVPRFRRDRTRRRAGVAAVSALGVVILGAAAVWLVPRLDPSPAAAAHSSGAGQSAQPTSPPPAGTGGGALATPGSQAPHTAEAKVVLAYFAAINNRKLAAAWSLGGDNLYPSQSALITSYGDIKTVRATIIGVRGDIVLARLRTTENSGTVVVSTQEFTVKNGAIVADTSA
jgi:eukaryotic-like serine/threonine-protein kinase